MSTTTPNLTALSVPTLTFLAREINDAQREIEYAAKSMLFEARRAGLALIEAKKQVGHGHFKAWVEANCRVSYNQARKYMQVAKVTPQGQFDWSTGINAFLDAHAAHKAPTFPSSSFAQGEAVYALKLHALATRGVGGEAAAAQGKLETLAKDHGMTTEAMVAKAEALCPHQDKTDHQAEADHLRNEVAALRAELAAREAITAQAVTQFGPVAGEEIARLRLLLRQHGIEY